MSAVGAVTLPAHRKSSDLLADEEAFDETVHDVYQKGYKMGKKVIRPAMVTITTGGPKRPKPEESGDEE